VIIGGIGDHWLGEIGDLGDLFWGKDKMDVIKNKRERVSLMANILINNYY